MAKWKVTIKETLVRVVEVDAEDAQDAEDAVRNAYNNSDIVLVADDFNDVEITAEQNISMPKGLTDEIAAEIKTLRVDAKESWEPDAADRYRDYADALEWVLGLLSGEDTPRSW